MTIVPLEAKFVPVLRYISPLAPVSDAEEAFLDLLGENPWLEQ